MSSTFNRARSTLRKPQRSLVALPVVAASSRHSVVPKGTPEIGLVRQANAIHQACGRDPKTCMDDCSYCDELGFTPARAMA